MFLVILVNHYFQLDTNVAGKRIGLVREGFDGCEADVQEVVRTAILKLTQSGAIVEETSVQWHAKGDCLLYSTVCTLPVEL